MVDPQLRSTFKQMLKYQSKKLISSKPSKEQLFFLYNVVMNRVKFEYSFRHVILYFIRCLACRRNSVRNEPHLKRDYYLNKGGNKLRKDLDIVQMLHMIHGFDALQSVLFDNHDRQLLYF